MKIPNLVIAGAPRCGTTSIFEYLANHPDVCASDTKETYFFMDKVSPLKASRTNYLDHGIESYANYFTNYSKFASKITLEATPHYLYQKTALALLPTLVPPVKLMFILRKPSARIWSEFNFRKGNISSQSKNLSLKEFVEGAKANHLQDEESRNVLEYTKYVDYLVLFKEKCKEDQMLVYLFEDLKKDTAHFMRRLCGDIWIDSSFYNNYNFPIFNESVVVKNQIFHKVRRKLIARINPWNALRKTQLIRLLHNFYYQLNTVKPNEKTSEDRAYLAQIDEEFKPYNEGLAHEFNLDLTAWN